MYNNNSNGSRTASARGFMALCAIMLALGGASMVSRAEAAPFAYVTYDVFVSDVGYFKVSVIDTATNKVVATVPVGNGPFVVTVTPDGSHVYVANYYSNNVSVIDTVTNTMVATVPVGTHPGEIAIPPDGKHVYVAGGSNNVSVIDTVTNTVVAVVPGGSGGVAVNPDGKHAYIANYFSNNVSVIDTATNTVVATVTVGTPSGVAVTPDGKHAYVAGLNTVSVIDTVTNAVSAVVPGVSGDVAVNPDGKHVYVTKSFGNPGTVSVIATATNKVVATIPVGSGVGFIEVAVTPDGKQAYVANFEDLEVLVIDTANNKVVTTIPTDDPNGIAVTPDGKHVYVPNYASGGVSVIDTVTNMVVAGVQLAGFVPETIAVGIVPPPPGVPFLAFSSTLAIDFDGAPTFNLHSNFTLSGTAPAIHPHFEPVTLQVGTFTVTIPPGSFKKQADGSFTFAGTIGGVSLQASINPTGTLRYAFNASATGASLTGTKNEVYVTLTIGGDSGATSVTAQITH